MSEHDALVKCFGYFAAQVDDDPFNVLGSMGPIVAAVEAALPPDECLEWRLRVEKARAYVAPYAEKR